MSGVASALLAISPGLVAGGLAGLVHGVVSSAAGYGVLALLLGLLGYAAMPDRNYGTSFYSVERIGMPPDWAVFMLRNILPLNAVSAVVGFAAMAFVLSYLTKPGSAG